MPQTRATKHHCTLQLGMVTNQLLDCFSTEESPLMPGPIVTKHHYTRLLGMVTNQLFDCFSTEEPPSKPLTRITKHHCIWLLGMAMNQLFDCFSTEEPPSMPQTRITIHHCTLLFGMVTNQLFDCFSTKEPTPQSYQCVHLFLLLQPLSHRITVTDSFHSTDMVASTRNSSTSCQNTITEAIDWCVFRSLVCILDTSLSFVWLTHNHQYSISSTNHNQNRFLL